MLALVRALILVLVAIALPSVAGAVELRALAGVDAEKSFADREDGALVMKLHLSQPVPYRVFALSDPSRIVLDFQEVDWAGVPPDFLGDAAGVSQVRFGVFRPGWSRMVLELDRDHGIKSAELDTKGGDAVLRLAVSPDIAPKPAAATQAWMHDPARAHVRGQGKMVVAIDPGHGGIDPGAVRDGVAEKDIALAFAHELRDLILDSGDFKVLLTREDDTFLTLRDRIRVAQEAQADVLLSIHANTVTAGVASGATVYSLSERASDAATARLAQLENRSDVAAGLDLSIEDDAVAATLLDMARAETNPRSKRFAEAVVRGLEDTVGVIRSRPHRSAGFLVLKAPDIPSLLLELGFLSNGRDLANMRSRQWRAQAARGVMSALRNWSAEDRVLSQLLMK